MCRPCWRPALHSSRLVDTNWNLAETSHTSVETVEASSLEAARYAGYRATFFVASSKKCSRVAQLVRTHTNSVSASPTSARGSLNLVEASPHVANSGPNRAEASGKDALDLAEA